MSGREASIACDSCGHTRSSSQHSENELRHELMTEHGWVSTYDRSGLNVLDACHLSECRNRIVEMVE